MSSTIRVAALALAAALSAACATTAPLRQAECAAPDAQLAVLIQQYQAMPAGACSGDTGLECARLRADIERLSMACPSHEPTLLTQAVLAYDDQEVEKAQQHLDRIFARPGSHPEAAVLRARVAIEQGNLPYAQRLLNEQLKLAPDRAEIHEALASVFFLTRRYAEAQGELGAADRLGAPRWRVAYHLGLIAEAEGRKEDAERLFTESAAAESGIGQPAPAARLRGLRAYDQPKLATP